MYVDVAVHRVVAEVRVRVDVVAQLHGQLHRLEPLGFGHAGKRARRSHPPSIETRGHHQRRDARLRRASSGRRRDSASSRINSTSPFFAAT